jgi:hypothetical protein
MQIIIERGLSKPLEEFPSYSIALDGASPGPKLLPEEHKFSFDHHAFCSRFCTLSTAAQCLNAVALGLDSTDYTVYCNDVDLDVCGGYWVLKNPERFNEPLVQKLISAINIGDCFLGAIPMNGMSKIIKYISTPEVESKKNDDYSKLSDDGLMNILEATMHRIDEFVDSEINNNDLDVPKHGDYKIIRDENDWVLVESGDTHITSHLYQIGYNKIVRYHKQKDGSMEVTIAKKSDFITNFSIGKIVEAFNKIENGWGGGSSVAGGPRNHDGSRSRLSLEKIIETIDACIK